MNWLIELLCGARFRWRPTPAPGIVWYLVTAEGDRAPVPFRRAIEGKAS